uniref:Uncharacterized protein n=1 Tax=Arion vulgaris TaxID=1028688 RepID=A0A0B6ZAI6_9EUPU
MGTNKNRLNTNMFKSLHHNITSDDADDSHIVSIKYSGGGWPHKDESCQYYSSWYCSRRLLGAEMQPTTGHTRMYITLIHNTCVLAEKS